MATERQVTLVLKTVAKGGDLGKLFQAPTMKTAGAPLEAVGKHLKGYGDSIGKLQESLKPDVILATARAQFDLNDKQREYDASLKAVKEALQPPEIRGFREWQDRMEAMGDATAKLNRAMDPALIEATARAQNELDAAQRAHGNALAKSRGDQFGLLGGFRQGLTGSIGPVTRGGIGQAAGGALASGGGVMGALQAGLGAAGPVGMVAGQAVGMAVQGVGKASPATMERFNKALDDLSAVLGRTLIPVFEAVSDVVRTFADILVKPAQALAIAFKLLMAPIRIAAAFIGAVFGAHGQSFGAAAKPASMVGLAEHGQRAQLAALESGLGAQDQLGVLNAIDQKVAQIVSLIQKAEKVTGAGGKAIGGAVDAMNPTLGALARGVGLF